MKLSRNEDSSLLIGHFLYKVGEVENCGQSDRQTESTKSPCLNYSSPTKFMEVDVSSSEIKDNFSINIAVEIFISSFTHEQ